MGTETERDWWVLKMQEGDCGQGCWAESWSWQGKEGIPFENLQEERGHQSPDVSLRRPTLGFNQELCVSKPLRLWSLSQ